MDYQTLTIHIDSLKPGMLIAQDIKADSGEILVSKNAKINQRSIAKLNLYQVKYVQVRQKVSESDMKNISDQPLKIPVSQTKNFKEFESKHEIQQGSVKNQMLNISDGKEIDLSELFAISRSLMSNIGEKSSLFSFLGNLQTFDDYTYAHCVNVSLVSYTLGQWLDFPEEELMNIAVAGLLHDIGKTKIDLAILNKPGVLTDAEFEEIKKHTTYGFRIVEKQKIPYNIKMAVLMHHEKHDGSGYPMGAKDSQINDYAKIVAIADIYDAMTANRPYRDKYSPFQVIQHMQSECLGKLDTFYLMTFLEKIAYCYLDNWVLLSTGEEAKIKFINKSEPAKPIVQIDSSLVDLSEERNVLIEKII